MPSISLLMSLSCSVIISISLTDLCTLSFPSWSCLVVELTASEIAEIPSISSATYFTTSSAEEVVLEERSFIWLATTAKPLPASPALAASMDAFKASRPLFCAIFLTISKISFILIAFSLKLDTWSFIFKICSEEPSTIRMLEFISSIQW